MSLAKKIAKFNRYLQVLSIFVISVISAAVGVVSAAVDTNVSDGVTLGGTVINAGLGAWMEPPLAYILGIVLFMMGFYAVAGLIKGRRRGKG